MSLSLELFEEAILNRDFFSLVVRHLEIEDDMYVTEVAVSDEETDDIIGVYFPTGTIYNGWIDDDGEIDIYPDWISYDQEVVVPAINEYEQYLNSLIKVWNTIDNGEKFKINKV